MKIAIMGSGGLGGFFGGWLAASGADVSFVARGAHLNAMRKNGLTVTSPLGDIHIDKVTATDVPAQIGPVDVVLFCVKNYDLETAATLCLPLVKPDTAVISILNGIDAGDRIGAVLGVSNVVPGVTYVPSNIAEPGVIAHLGNKTDLTFGELDGTDSPRLRDFRDACIKANLNAQISDDITTAIWTKFVGWSATSAVTSANRRPFGDIQSIPEIQQLFLDVATETHAVGCAVGAKLPDDLVARFGDMIQTYPPEAKSSMLVDLERGKPLELETACGTVVRLGGELEVDTPINRALYAVLLPYANGS